jgi:hypothetical protein
MRVLTRLDRITTGRGATIGVLAWITLAMIAVVVGPFSTFDTMTVGFRVVYWGGIIASAALLGEAIRRVVAQYPGLDPFRADVIGSAVMAPLFGSAVTAFNAFAMGSMGPIAPALGTNILVVFLVCCGVVLFRAYGRHLTSTGGSGRDAEMDDSALPGFLREVDPEIARAVLWIEADDHYLRVHAPAGSARVLMRFRDALEELSGLPGMQVHRSHWVRIDAIEELRPSGRRHVAVLPGGKEVPVSRSYLGDLEMAGVERRDEA